MAVHNPLQHNTQAVLEQPLLGYAAVLLFCMMAAVGTFLATPTTFQTQDVASLPQFAWQQGEAE
ncbi:hypothetical protein [Teichococcus vastitatis]|uniref:hypothetical protein n=1 Tax=Teichococcus vastitatis TaxID=2307076 RepID=UPI000E71C3DF|nr:hypothetical protein [Pseudoroseomonas vastitatis]